jgi:hypothetical protein
MNKTILIFGIFVLTIATWISCSDNQQSRVVEEATTSTDIKILQSWQGNYPSNQLNLLPEGQREQVVGYINDTELFSVIWQHFKPGEDTPAIDFNTHLVLFVRNTMYYNRISIGKITMNNGVLDVLAMETMSAMPIEENVALSLAMIPLKGITAINVGDKKVTID